VRYLCMVKCSIHLLYNCFIPLPILWPEHVHLFTHVRYNRQQRCPRPLWHYAMCTSVSFNSLVTSLLLSNLYICILDLRSYISAGVHPR
jgi:hypothetical protein